MQALFQGISFTWNWLTGQSKLLFFQEEDRLESSKLRSRVVSEDDENSLLKLSLSEEALKENFDYSFKTWMMLGVFLRENHQWEQAERVFKKAMQMVEESAKRMENSENAFSSSSLTSPNVSLLLLEMARNLEKLGKIEQAIEKLEKVIQLNVSKQDKVDALAELAWIYLSDEKFEKARLFISQIEELGNEDKRTRQLISHLLGNYHLSMGEPDLALQHYEKTVELDSTCVDALAVLGDIYFHHKKEKSKARTLWERAFTIDPLNNSISHYKLSNIIMKEDKNYERAKSILDAALKVDAKDANSNYLMAFCLDEMQCEAKDVVMFHYSEAMRLECQKKNLFVRFSDYLVRLGKYEWAIGILNTGMKLKPKETITFLSLREKIYETTKNYQNALDDCELLLKLISQTAISGSSSVYNTTHATQMSRDEVQERVATLKQRL
ncbi:hypothetical protein FDP41_001941 [Naegleria fowleri]|uniref:MalT-like TPR region domain-containing protein n=1 Tax=Naegleria fowleri TaxID=5763 RepID=A0A6A5BWM4_NAEFO|nr:uncharacterized protein FDP41_001941 [Naegleria fowleri]KAF0978871.1 hypothetical protein FDP41_001941 [Naegleria fowleri]